MNFLENEPLVSVIIPVYNVEKYIRKCIDSVITQTYKNLQIVLVDDGSPDNCPKICEDYAANEKRIIVVHQKNQGLAAARNTGLDNASGEYIFFVDSDDYIDECLIERMVDTAKTNNADMVLCNFVCVDEYGNRLNNIISKKLEETQIDSKEMVNQSIEVDAAVLVVAWNKLYKKELWEHYRYPVGKIHEDEFAFHHIVLQCKIIVCIGYEGYYYVQREGSIMSTRSLKSTLDAMDAYIDRLDYVASDMKDFAQKIILRCYFSCSELYEFKKDRQLLREYLQKIKRNFITVFDGHTPMKYLITYYGLWYEPTVFSLFLRQYRELWKMVDHMKGFNKIR